MRDARDPEFIQNARDADAATKKRLIHTQTPITPKFSFIGHSNAARDGSGRRRIDPRSSTANDDDDDEQK